MIIWYLKSNIYCALLRCICNFCELYELMGYTHPMSLYLVNDETITQTPVQHASWSALRKEPKPAEKRRESPIKIPGCGLLFHGWRPDCTAMKASGQGDILLCCLEGDHSRLTNVPSTQGFVCHSSPPSVKTKWKNTCCIERSEGRKQNYWFSLLSSLVLSIIFVYNSLDLPCSEWPFACSALHNSTRPDPIASLGNRANGLPGAQSQSGGGRSDLLYN